MGPSRPPRPPARRHRGLDPALFGKPVDGGAAVEAESLAVAAPSVLEIRIPAELAAGRELVVSGGLAPGNGAEASVQLELTDRPVARESLGRLRPGVPVVVQRRRSRIARGSRPGWTSSAASSPPRSASARSCRWTRSSRSIQFFRADEPFARLMLDDAGRARLDRLWDELHYVSQDGIRVYQTFDQMLGFASQEGQTAKVEASRKPITASYEAPSKVQAASEPKHLDALLAFAARAYRRPLADREDDELRRLYRRLRGEEAEPRRGLPADAGPGAGLAGRSSTGSSGPGRAPRRSRSRTGSSPAG